MKSRLICLLVFFCTLYVQAFSQDELIYSEVTISIPKDKIPFLQKAGVSFDHGHYDEEKKTLTTVLNQDDLKIVKRFLYKYRVNVEDLAKEFVKNNKPEEFYKYANDPVSKEASRFVYDAPNGLVVNNFTTPAAFTTGAMGGYYTLAQIIQKIDDMVSGYPGLVRKDTIGYTHENRPMIAVKISSNVNTESGKPEVLYTGMHHSREPMSMMNLIFFMQYLLENYSSNSLVQELVNNRSLYFIPCVNPDGYERNRSTNSSGGGLHRKNRRPNANTTNMGVDLNRNYSYGWNDANAGSSTMVNNDAYRGPSAASEPETQAMMNFINSRNFKFALNYHAFGEYWINSYCVTPAPADELSPLENRLIETAGHLMTRTNYYAVGTPIQTVGYNARGSSDDWFMAGSGHNRVYCFSPEVGPTVYSSGSTVNTGASFWPVAARIIPLAKEVMFSNFQAAYIAGSYHKLEDRSSLAVSSASGSFSFTLRRLGLTNASATVSIVPLQNIQSVGLPVTISSLANPLDTVNRSITYMLSPGIQMGQKIRFLWRVSSGGITLVDTITKIYNPTVVFSDNMETGSVGTNWTTTGTWNYSTNSSYEGTRSLVTNTAANYTASSNSTATISNALNLSSSNSAYMSFWTRYRSQNGVDILRIQARVGSGSWQSLPSLHTIAETKTTTSRNTSTAIINGTPALSGIQDFWVREIVDLSAFADQTNVQIRFTFQSNGEIQHNGFFIDNVEVFKSMSSSLPVTFNSIKATATSTGITVSWEAETNEQHDYFVVEHSTDGITFSQIGIVRGSGYNFSFTHRSPEDGVNYYRVKGVDKDRTYNYTSVVSARYGNSASLRIYPNPVTDILQVKVGSMHVGNYDFEIISTTGQVVRKINKDLNGAFSTFNIAVDNIASGTYVLQIKNNKQVVFSETFIKANK